MTPALPPVPGQRTLPGQGEPAPDPAARGGGRSRLARVLRRGDFAVTTELSPPDSADPAEIQARARVVAAHVDAINATDSSGANCHMSSMGVCALLAALGHSAILQISCRDRNRIAMQGDVLAAAALGIENVLCLTGDGVQAGDHPEAKPVFDLDSVSLLGVLRHMRDESRFLSGRKLSHAPDLFLGAAENPFAPPLDFRPLRLAKKIAAGAQFVQTQYCFDLPRLRTFVRRVDELGFAGRCFLLVGVGPLPSARNARWMRANVPGVHIPDSVIARIEGAEDQAREGIDLCVELIQEMREMEGVSGVHVMAYKQEHAVAEIVERSGARAGRSPSPADGDPAGAERGAGGGRDGDRPPARPAA